MSSTKPLADCAVCGTEIPYAATRCIGCGEDVGFPNVRAADSDEEIEALRVRLKEAQASALARGCSPELEEFGTASEDSQAIMVRTLAALDAFVSNDQGAMISYYKMVRAGMRIPENNEWDENRGRVDGAINPHMVYEELQFAALSLNGSGVSWYGDYSITLKDAMIRNRASVFEENPFKFLDKHPIAPKGSVPNGYRASWARRGELAMAKLHPRIKSGMSYDDFVDVLVEQGAKDSESDFIEVHIYGAIHMRAVERVIAVPPKRPADRQIWKRVKRKLDAIGAVVEEV